MFIILGIVNKLKMYMVSDEKTIDNSLESSFFK